jgi:hypothetical protein
MNKSVKLAAAGVSLLLLSFVSIPQKRALCEGFLPKNDLRIPEGDVQAEKIKKKVFNEVMDRAQEIYGPVIAARGGKLVINRLWKDPTVNASAEQLGEEWILNMYGGLARHKDVSAEGFALVVCHELGHHLGGFPKYGGDEDEWASNEGGADYFATLKCLRNVFPGETVPEDIDAFAAKACRKAYPEGSERNICLSNALAGHSIAKLFQDLRGSDIPPAFDTPDGSVVDETYDSHPETQCRLDTYFQGALCTKPVSEDVSATSPAPGACTASQGFKQGLRPLCWYRPAEGEALLPGLAVRPLGLPGEKSLDERLQSLRGALSGSGR